MKSLIFKFSALALIGISGAATAQERAQLVNQISQEGVADVQLLKDRFGETLIIRATDSSVSSAIADQLINSRTESLEEAFEQMDLTQVPQRSKGPDQISNVNPPPQKLGEGSCKTVSTSKSRLDYCTDRSKPYNLPNSNQKFKAAVLNIKSHGYGIETKIRRSSQAFPDQSPWNDNYITTFEDFIGFYESVMVFRRFNTANFYDLTLFSLAVAAEEANPYYDFAFATSDTLSNATHLSKAINIEQQQP